MTKPHAMFGQRKPGRSLKSTKPCQSCDDLRKALAVEKQAADDCRADASRMGELATQAQRINKALVEALGEIRQAVRGKTTVAPGTLALIQETAEAALRLAEGK